MLVGAPGSGKSTFVHKTQMSGEWGPYTVLSTDAYIVEEAENEGKTYNEVFRDTIKDAEKYFNWDIEEHIQSGRNVIIDRTNMSRKSRAKILQRFLDAGYECEAFVFQAPRDLDVLNEGRPGKEIPVNVMLSMINNYQAPDFDEGFYRITYVKPYTA
jgi:predicted kinase